MRAWLYLPASAGRCALTVVPVREATSAQQSGVEPQQGLTLALLRGISTLTRPLSIPGIASAAGSHLQLTLENPGAALTELWRQAQVLRRAARVYLGVQGSALAQLLFEGVVTGVDLGEQVQLTLEAGLDRPMSDTLPLRTSSVWGGWRDVKTLPWVWGRCTLAPVQYSADQRVFVLADHPVQAVEEVKRDDVPSSSWHWRNGLDSTGRAVAFIELAEPLAEGERLAVSLRGRMHPQSARLLTTPAEILHDLLVHLAGADVPWAALDAYRTASADVELGVVMNDASITVRAAVDRVMQSAGSVWAAAMPGWAMLWPAQEQAGAQALVIDRLSASDLRASAQASELCTALRVLYDYDDAAGRFRRAVQLRAVDAARDYGELALEWQAPALRSARSAQQLGERLLGWLARPRWRVRWRQALADVATGAWVDLRHPLSPVQGLQRLMSADIDWAQGTLECEVWAAVGEPPRIETTRLSSAFEPVIASGITVQVANGQIIFTARDDQGQPLAGARITLDGDAQRIADANGRVSFAAARGRHVLRIEAQGYPTSEAEVVV